MILKVYTISALALVGLLVGGNLYYRDTTAPPAAVAATAPVLQKFRFGIVCPDGSRVEYVATERLPKSEMCYPDPE